MTPLRGQAVEQFQCQVRTDAVDGGDEDDAAAAITFG